MNLCILYWLRLIKKASLISDEHLQPLLNEAKELVKKSRLLGLAGDQTRIRILCIMFQNRKACVSDIASSLEAYLDGNKSNDTQDILIEKNKNMHKDFLLINPLSIPVPDRSLR